MIARTSLVAVLMLALAVPSAAHAKVVPSPTYARSYGQDRAEIEDLMARYLFAIDYFDWDSYVATFTDDGELEFAVPGWDVRTVDYAVAAASHKAPLSEKINIRTSAPAWLIPQDFTP